MVTAKYLIVIDGELDPAFAPELAPAVVTTGGGRTQIRTAAVDQAALLGLLDRLASFGLTLLSIASDDAHASTDHRGR